ncbi:MAG TPA: ParB/RepB/Spo0J family partition protein [Acidobacteriota bacterium]|nr:ParB/RepB/Spo0J family partition protein [Acidobacteriota bacterium]
MKRKALGRGLDALLPKKEKGSSLVELDLDQIHPNPLQPRLHFRPERLDELAASLAQDGVLQPIVVRQANHGFEIVAGERRWRAAQKAGLQKIPALIQEVSNQRMLELALVENIQRDELSPIEEAHAYQIMIDDFGLTQEQISARVGRSRTAVANILRLLRLPKELQKEVIDGKLSMGHARALLPLKRRDQLELARTIVKDGLPVREAEKRVRRILEGPTKPPKAKDPNVRSAEKRLEDAWNTRVEIRQRGNKGQIVFHFHSKEELDRLYENLLR